ncbi:MAG: maleate cis-trans isomerase family protein [Candidatus Binatia bacterium]
MSYTSWRGVVGVIKPTMRTGSLEEFIRLLPDGIGVIPLFLQIKRGDEDEFRAALRAYEARIDELAEQKVDLLHPEGAPPFMVHGYQGEQEIVKQWEKKHGIPVITAGMTQVEALKALKAKKVLGVTYFTGEINNIFTSYFQGAGFEILAMEGISVPFSDVGRLSGEEVYAHTKKAFVKNPGADAIYMLGSGWRTLNIVATLERDLRVPVVHAVPARVWAVQKRLHIRQPVKGYGQLLEAMP